MNPYTLTLLRHAPGTPEDAASALFASWRRIVELAPVTAMATGTDRVGREFAVARALAAGVPLRVDERFDDPRSSSLDLSEWFDTLLLTGFSEWICETRGSHRVLVAGGEAIASLMAELLGIGRSTADLLEVRPGGFAQLTLLEGHPAYLMRLEPPPRDFAAD
ncbi:histidine phosphatase family protein [Paludibacterium paludis]|uniref:Phosphoglycerate mutase n=1 Tax=Paludibacterium paludis TaxID=1225769 RepID=A0A918P405_9NEIS|nr:histidine phosphatase family protein [Paludibacterium paludis]GGY15981.1 hypothetical protein GCM10011289_19210 [Paludibacterium paludis]